VNSKNKFGHTAIGYVRNRGLEVATGDYIAFLDDDDIMLPDSLYEKLKYMMNNSDFVCSDAYIGNGAYNLKNTYKKYNEENYIENIKNIYLENNSNAMCYGFPSKFDNEFISIHNTVITSTVMMSKNLIDKVGKFSLASYGEDWDYWKRATLFTEIDYIKTPLSYYDASHGDGVQY
jgi:glycosyltransferase involved in cell wall biosynthesis